MQHNLTLLNDDEALTRIAFTIIIKYNGSAVLQLGRVHTWWCDCNGLGSQYPDSQLDCYHTWTVCCRLYNGCFGPLTDAVSGSNVFHVLADIPL
jgi:hypothetical protein